ncbi:hypothetical protein MASR1M104_21510 [Cloacibacterium normanense]
MGNFKAQNLLLNDSDRRINFYQQQKYKLKANYLNKRKSLNLSYELKQNLKKLSINYFAKINNELKIINKISNDDELYKAITLQSLGESYPDINAVFFNRGNLLSDDKISDEEKQKYNALFLEISKQIPNETYIELSKITDEINRDKFALTVPYRFEIFQDLFDENQRKRIDIINFLLWNVE